ncbi:MAG: C45 family peptidase [Pseudomonadota bacterium]
MEMLFRSVAEDAPGPKWKALFDDGWPAYRQWFLSEGIEERATYAHGRAKLKRYMPELLPTYERLCELSGGLDLQARFLALYRPPAYLTGCSQVVWPGDEPVLIRNYDYSPTLCEGLVLLSRWNGKAVLAMVDCLWGVLDGVNEDGLAISLTFGGRKVVGDGFGIPVVLRYILEFCSTAEEAAEVMSRVPVHMAYNVTAVDRKGRFITAFAAPDRKTRVRELPIAANHQGNIDWHSYARATATLERERFLYFRLREQGMTLDRMLACFHRTPLYTTAFVKGFGTLYTAAYWPQRGEARFLWPNGSWGLSIESFEEGQRLQSFRPEALASSAG